VTAPAMTRPLDHGMYDVPLLTFGNHQPGHDV
jgi:hypothetical protein